jgi:hypothetical protein
MSDHIAMFSLFCKFLVEHRTGFFQEIIRDLILQWVIIFNYSNKALLGTIVFFLFFDRQLGKLRNNIPRNARST